MNIHDGAVPFESLRRKQFYPAQCVTLIDALHQCDLRGFILLGAFLWWIACQVIATLLLAMEDES